MCEAMTGYARQYEIYIVKKSSIFSFRNRGFLKEKIYVF